MDDGLLLQYSSIKEEKKPPIGYYDKSHSNKSRFKNVKFS